MFTNERISKANINADWKLKVTLLDGGDSSDRYEVKEKGYGCISLAITSPSDYLITQIDTSKVGEYKLGFKVIDRNGVSQEKYVTIKVIKKEDNNTLAIIILTSFIVIVLAIGGITVFIIKKIRKSK